MMVQRALVFEESKEGEFGFSPCAATFISFVVGSIYEPIQWLRILPKKSKLLCGILYFMC